MPPEDSKPEDVKKPVAPVEPTDEFVYKRDANKSMRQIASESSRRNREAKDKELQKQIEEVKKPVEKKKEIKVDQTASNTPTEPIQEEKIDIEKIKKETAAEAAKAAKEEASKEFQAQVQKYLDQEKTDLEKQKDVDELISVFEKEKRLPTDYKEVLLESQRLAEAKYRQLQKQADEKRHSDETEKKQKETIAKTEAQKVYELKVDEINRKVANELDELYQGSYLKKPPASYSETDEAQKETDELMKFGIQLNTERTKKGLPPVDSIAKIYFMHYKPYKEAQGVVKKEGDQPAGADAPISGARSVQAPSQDKGYVYARDHKKSYRQILTDNLNRIRGR